MGKKQCEIYKKISSLQFFHYCNVGDWLSSFNTNKNIRISLSNITFYSVANDTDRQWVYDLMVFSEDGPYVSPGCQTLISRWVFMYRFTYEYPSSGGNYDLHVRCNHWHWMKNWSTRSISPRSPLWCNWLLWNISVKLRVKLSLAT